MMPGLSLGFACLFIGGVTIFYGVVRIVAYARGGVNGDKLDLFIGVLLVLLGLFLLIWTRFLVALIPLVLGIYIQVRPRVAGKTSGHESSWLCEVVESPCLVAVVLAVCGLADDLKPFATVELW